jgi:RNA polymerase sigma-70 factor, ECF subfamily
MRDPLTSAELLVLAGEGDRPAFAELWDDLGGPIVALAARVLDDEQAAEDATVAIFKTAWRAAATFDPDRSDAVVWVFEIACAVLRDAGRPMRAEVAEEQFELLRLHAAIAALPPRERVVVEHVYGSGSTPRQIALRTGWSLGTVKTRLRNAMGRLADEVVGEPL